MANTVTAHQTGRGEKSRATSLGRGIGQLLRTTVVGLFRALREGYWLIDRDAKVRSQGLQTEGRVVKTETREHRGSEWDTHYTHHVTYEYQVDSRRHTAEKEVGSLGDLRRSVPIRVYFLPGTYPLRSAIDRTPRGLVESGTEGLKSGPGQSDNRGSPRES